MDEERLLPAIRRALKDDPIEALTDVGAGVFLVRVTSPKLCAVDAAGHP